MAARAPRFRIEALQFFERDVRLRLPFRFGAATVTACPQVYVRARIRLADGRASTGCAAEMMIPKWFDKNPRLTHEQNFEQLRQALALAREAYLSEDDALSAWGHFEAHHALLAAQAQRRYGLNPLAASYGPALVDRALIDALCLAHGMSFAQAMQANLCGIAPADLAPDLRGFAFDDFLAARRPREQIAARHTVGLADALDTEEAAALAQRPDDGLPLTLQDAIARHGHRHFKLKLGGDTAADLQRLRRIWQHLAPVAEVVTLDGNEQYADAAAFGDFLAALLADPALAGLVACCAFIEQPIARAHAMAQDLHAAAARMPLLVDESDGELDSFVQAQALGYAGVSSKSCKGVYKSVINAARCAAGQARGAPLFQSGEDLTMQAGVGVQQDLALVGWLGLAHVERNGHHYVNGMAALPPEEQQAFLRRHPGLYEHSAGAVRLRIHQGRLDLRSLAQPGLGTGVSGAGIHWDAMRNAW